MRCTAPAHNHRFSWTAHCRQAGLAAGLVALAALSSCRATIPVHPTPDATAGAKRAASAASPSIAQFQHDVETILAAPALDRSYWGILIKSLRNNDTLYAVNPGKLLMPGSAMKIVTLAAAADQLGWDYSYETRLVAAGTISDGILKGDLVVVGSGDPSIGDRDGTAARLFAEWADALKTAGVHVVSGRIIGDDNAFDDEELGAGWAWDDLAEGFAARVGALQFNENAVRVTVTPAFAAGAPAVVSLVPASSGLVVDHALTTAPGGTPAAIEARRLPGSTRLELRGSIPAGSSPINRSVSVDNPTLFFVNALRDALVAAGIEVRGSAVDIDNLPDPPARGSGIPLIVYKSPPLSALAITMMKQSQNLYAETLLKTIGASRGTPTMEASRAAAKASLAAWDVAPTGLIQVDGSGLSRYNDVTADALVTILVHVDRDGRLRTPFEAALPVGGRDGTLAARLKGTPAEGNVRAKTGTLANVRALAGYVTSADGEPLVFAIVGNNYGTTPDVPIAAIDAIVTRMAVFRR